MPITVKHSCGHYKLHKVNVPADMLAQIEIQLASQPCKDCKEKINEHNNKNPNHKVNFNHSA